ncbi:cyclic nucleotide-binding domain-containing protein [Oscillatoria sp. FACHB-1407]|uniref:cyclic nucleotide-binding domain-containing protein n=1 Tax=Oscillatoria sp. FACHB-1407 TaxID=2692847 RepID=UPI001682A935|nr:cyclic nucleotide-binding domain-containing protein [Oscillatoria sp. FACHB-1407]MBD2462687.1 cyclic nucleotide-binding domain-containing protein [Oscillatoria sp. FACHB-1407]
MAGILLQELSNTDIDWLITAGQQQQILAGTVLLQPQTESDTIHLLLDGILTVSVPQQGAGCAGAAMSDHPIEKEITRFSEGEVVGVTSLFNVQSTGVFVRAVKDSIVLSIPHQRLTSKLQQDSHFSTHFYRAIALILTERLQQMLTMPTQLRAATDQPVKEALFVFGELRDSDVDWLVAAGQLQKLAPNTSLIQAGRPLDALYIILDGLLSVSVYEGDVNPLTLCFECVNKIASSQKVIDRLSRGEMSGTSSFLTMSPSPVSVRAIEESLVLAIPRSQLIMKLQQDMGFASRFYRILALQLLEAVQTAIELLGCPQQPDPKPDQMDQDMEYDDELNLESLHHVSQGAARFSWMLKRLGIT